MKKTFFVIALMISAIGFSQDIAMENGTFNRCEPDRFFDSGGEFGNYGNDENLVTTICPQNAGDFIILEFTEFTTQQGLNADVMNIYDGDDISAPLIGTFQGPVGAFTVTATEVSNTSGCLTIEFISGDSGNVNGWAANILCASQCQDIFASIDNTVPAPNNSGVVSILPGETVDFTASATFSQDGSNATYDWDFNDGNVATGTNVSNTFINTGTYTVTLTVADDNPQGCSDTETITVFVLGSNVVVDQGTYTPEQLIEDVLVNSPCATVSNIVSSTGSDFSPSQPNGIGYFISNGVDFPFEDGILLTSGNASEARGPNNQNLSTGTSSIWPGDNDLDTQLGVSTNNATFIQFDFTPLIDQITFDFLMASEEYNMGSFECDFSDVFAFFLTDSMGNTTNLAVLPGTNTPILVTNIHLANSSCGAVNPQYFGGYTAFNSPPTAFDGRTVVFTAIANVVPGEVYTIKLVIADDGDDQQDSGVFIPAGSFNLGGDLGEDITIEAGTAACGGASVTLDTEVTTATHTWYYSPDSDDPVDGVIITGETTSTIAVTEEGYYFVDVVFDGVCQSSDSIFVEFRPNPTASVPEDLFACDVGGGTATFDLTENNGNILGTEDPNDFVISYHFTQQDAIDNLAVLPDSYTNISNPQIIWARMADNSQSCFDVVSFTINISDLPLTNSVSDIVLCDDATIDGFTEFDLSTRLSEILGGQTDVNVSFHDDQMDADNDVDALPNLYTNVENPQSIYVRLENINNENCYVVTTFELLVSSGFTVDPPADLSSCDDFSEDGFEIFDFTQQTADILGPLTDVTLTYHLSQGDADNNVGSLSNLYQNIDNPQTIFVRLEDNTNPLCFVTSSFEIEVLELPTVVVPTVLEVCDDGVPDGFTEIDLSIKNTEITGNNPNYMVSYYLTLADAEAGLAPLPIPYTNISNCQTVFARVEDTVTGCYDTTALDLCVEQAPVANVPEPLRYCDPDNDGFGMFPLDDSDNEITGGAPGLTVTYHETFANADNNVDAIDTSVDYNNIVVDAQTLYARVESATIATDCATIVE
uniref:choice-of-anchor L domain-containing protein n=1 Tax=Winogradskyella sp. TaxID=1883156 RepID=UPI0026343F22